jgi:two-component system, NarL family, nitrate/nitrite response regulator NarL
MRASSVKRVILADDHPLVLSGLQALVNTTHEFQIVATCSTGAEASETIRTLEPDLAVLDVRMPDLTGVDILELIDKEGLGTRAILLSGSITDEEITRGVNAGAWGIVLKFAAVEELLECLHEVAAGRRFLPRDVVDAAFDREAARRGDKEEYSRILTSREQQIAALVAQGLSNKLIAVKTRISEGTVKIHLHNIYQKLGVSNRTSLAMRAQQELLRIANR